jgi:transcriptional regulator NrdR family protein
MYQVIKRDGKLKEFDISRIIDAIKSAFEAKQKSYTDATI